MKKKNDVGHDAENLCLLDSLLISANQQLTSPEVAQKWRKQAEMAFFKEKWQKKTWKRKKKAIQDAQTYIRISTDQRQVPDVTGSGAKMALVGGSDVFLGKTLEKDMKMKKKDVGRSNLYQNIN